jgi:hypothetical protein
MVVILVNCCDGMVNKYDWFTRSAIVAALYKVEEQIILEHYPHSSLSDVCMYVMPRLPCV